VNQTVPRLSRTEQLILELLADGDTFGLDLVERSQGRLKRGTVYVTLARMQQKGYLESHAEAKAEGAIGLPRRLYKPTAFGLRVMAAWALAARAFSGPLPQEI
jgi:PadR family transcriptional regulator